MKRGWSSRRRRSRRDGERAGAATPARDEAAAEARCAELAAQVAAAVAPAQQLPARFAERLDTATRSWDTALAECEAVFEAALAEPGAFRGLDHLYAGTEIAIDHATIEADRAYQDASDLVRTRRLPRPLLARLARALLRELAMAETALAGALDSERAALAIGQRWTESLARIRSDPTIPRGELENLAEIERHARARLAMDVAASRAVVAEHELLYDHLCALARLVVDRGERAVRF